MKKKDFELGMSGKINRRDFIQDTGLSLSGPGSANRYGSGSGTASRHSNS